MSAQNTRRGGQRHTGRLQRHGTVLLMVVGVLALMSIVAVVYVTIGQADRRGAAALIREQRLDDQSKAVADYLAGIIADDVVAGHGVVDPSNPGGPQLYVREAWDVASFDNAMRTQPTGSQKRFDPVGQGTDPWLSSPEPSWLRYVRTDSPRDPARRYLNNVDWDQISDPWPDGRFVNLGNIRGNFAVEPGIGRDADNRPRTSWGLTLFERPVDGAIQSPGTPANPVNNIKLDDNATNSSPNVPWHWATRQVNAFRPYRDVNSRQGAPGVGTLTAPFVTISDPRWLPNQWCDTDGDGLVDARWSDMVDTTDPSAPRPILRGDGSMRYFVATRIIDLSGLVNVNIAGDLHAPIPSDGTGDARFPLGMTPGDIDLRSLLTLSKVHDMYGPNDVYELYEQPQVTPALPSDYSDSPAYDADAARNVGFAGYSALRRSLAEGRLRQGAMDVSGGGDVFSRAAKYEAFQRMAAADGARHMGTGAGQYEAAFAFGIADQAELLTYWGTNDPAVTSTLESALDGRWDNGGGGANAPETRLGPMRSIRPLSVERDGVGNFYPAGAGQTPPHVSIGGAVDGLADDDALLKMATDPRHLLTTVSGARPIVSSPISEPGVPLTSDEVAKDVYELLERGNDGVDDIFEAYCQALLPWSGQDLPSQGTAIAQPPWVIEGDQFTSAKPDRARTLSYGYRGPELPLWMSAFMAVNLKDAYDTDDNPSSFTLVIDDSFKTGGSGWSTQRFSGVNFPNSITDAGPAGSGRPFWPNEEGRVLDLGVLAGTERIASTTSNHPPIDDPEISRRLMAPAVNIFGVEAQPFLTQVAMFACFTDTPDGQGGDNDSAPAPAPGDPVLPSKVSLNGEVTQGNNDFLFQVIAFQLHNPFDSSVTLPAGGEYSLQFGGSRFEFKHDITLDARSTKVVYCITPGRTQATARIAAAWVGTGAISIDLWLQAQLGLDTQQVTDNELDRYDVSSATGSTEIGETTVLDMLDSDAEANRVVLLWRHEGTGSTTRTILVDRMRDPELTGTPSLDRSFKLPSDTSLPGTPPEFIDNTDTAQPAEPDNTGFSLVTFGSFRRPDDPGAGAGIPLGAIPAFCLERRGFAPGSPNSDRPLNIGPGDDSSLRDGFTNLGPSATMDRSDFTGSLGAPSPGRTTLAALLTPQSGTAASDILVTSLTENPRSRSGHTIDTNIEGLNYNDRYIEAFLPNNRFRIPAAGGQPEIKTMRPTDLMLPWALGSWELPGVSGLEKWQSERRANPTNTEPPLEWATLSEMLAMALDYEQPTAGRKDLFFDQTAAQPWRAGEQAYDRGCLRIDRFVPFMDMNNDKIFGMKPGVTPPEPEDVIPPGIPLATTIVERLKVREAGSLTRMVPGLVNVNTAPLEVLRALPGLTPPNASLDVGPNVWFWTGVQDSLCDIGATMLAYRDNVGIWPRDIAAGGVSSQPINFRQDNNPSPPGQNGFGRRWKTGIQALHQPYTKGTGPNQVDGRLDRSENGFRSIGETMIVRDGSIGAPPTGQPPDTTSFPYSIDRLGRDGVSVGGRPGQPIYLADTTRYNNGGTFVPNQIIDDYQEQFAISGALMNSISVRSDVFAAWFVLRGYAPADVEGLEIQEPMVPSVERRFLMIVDRSNVTQRGQKPRILLFKELPL